MIKWALLSRMVKWASTETSSKLRGATDYGEKTLLNNSILKHKCAFLFYHE